MEHKTRLLEVMLQRESSETCDLFHTMFEDIRWDLGMDANSSMEEVWSELSSCRTFHCKGTMPKLGRWFAWNDAAEEQLSEFHVLKLVLAYHYKHEKKNLDPDAQAECQAISEAAKLAARGDGSKTDMRKEFSALKEALGGGTKLAYFVMSEKLFGLCRILQTCTRPIWSFYSSEVKNTLNDSDSLARSINLQSMWQSEQHLQELAGVPLSRDPQLVRLISEKNMWDTGDKCLHLIFHLLSRRTWSFVRHSAPPECYAGILSSDMVLRQDDTMSCHDSN
jgi:hypothetical protein